MPQSAPAQLLQLQRTVGNQAVDALLTAQRAPESAHTHGCGCPGCCGVVQQAAPALATARPTLQRAPATALIQRSGKKAAYVQGYRDGYHEGFNKGLWDGLKELVGANILDKTTANSIYTTYHVVVDFVPGYNSDYDGTLTKKDNYDSGALVGRGAGLDRGYETALSEFGYDRQYAAIPSGNKQVAAQDNGGTCVYCNAAPIADIDHIEPLKLHWAAKGSTQDKTTRSAEANDTKNLVGSCAACNRSKGAKKLGTGWWPSAWGGSWWPFGPTRVKAHNQPPPYW